MLFCEVSRILARYFLYLAAILLLPLTVAASYEFWIEKKIYFSTPATFAFLETIALCLLFFQLFRFFSRKSRGAFYRKESILLVGLIWFFTTAIGALPFLFTKTIPNPIDACFESMSGLSTTGATIIQPKIYNSSGQEIAITLSNPTDPVILYSLYGTVPPLRDPVTNEIVKEGIEALGKPLLFWRVYLQWLGGMGIVVLFIAVLPALSMGGKFLFETEVPGPTKEGMTPRIKETASMLWKIYLGLTFLQTALLIITDPSIPLFDAVSLSFSTISTGGFTTQNSGLESYHHSHWVIALFMILGSLNFTLYFHALRGKIYRLYEPELLFYIVIIILGCLFMTWNLWNTPNFFSQSRFSLGEALKLGSFQAISAQTSTGFSLVNYDLWPFSCQILMMILMYIGGMSGSTSGGIKVIRYVIMLRLVKNKIDTLFRPEGVRSLKIGEREIHERTATTVLTFFCIVLILTILGIYLLVLDNNDPLTAIGTVACMINNAGLPFGGIGTNASFAFLSSFSKIVSILWMALGRLEYFSLLVLLVPAFWKKR